MTTAELVLWVCLSGLVGGGIYLAKRLVPRWLEDVFARRFAAFESRLRKAEGTISSLHSTSLDILARNQESVNERRIAALDSVWAAIVALKRQGKWPVEFVASVNLTAIVAGLEDAKVRHFIDVATREVSSIDSLAAQVQRPHLSEEVASLFDAYETAVGICVTFIRLLRAKVDPFRIARHVESLQTVRSALPDHAGFLDAHGLPGLLALLPIIEARLLAQIRLELTGAVSDLKTVDRLVIAASITSDFEQLWADVPETVRGDVPRLARPHIRESTARN